MENRQNLRLPSQDEFRPLMDFEKQIDDVFNRYYSKASNDKNELKPSLESITSLIPKNFSSKTRH